MHLRRKLAAIVFAMALMVAGPPAAHAATPTEVVPVPGIPVGMPITSGDAGNVGSTACGTAHGAEGVGGTGAADPIVCAGSGLVFVGPSSAVQNTIGPTIIAAGFNGVVTTANGSAVVGL